MGKKLILVLIALFIGGFIVMQSCNESPIMSPEPLGEKFYPGNEIYANNGITTPRIFAGVNDGKPFRCSTQGEKLELWAAGGTIHVGYIEFFDLTPPQTNIIKVRFIFDVNPFPDNFAVEQISFHIGDNLTDIPILEENGNYPDYPNFEFNEYYSPAFSPTTSLPYKEFEYTVPTDGNSDGFYVAAHVWVCNYGGLEGFNFNLPDGPVTYGIGYNSPSSYFKVNFLNGSGGILGTGPYESFCVDADLNVYPPDTLTGHVYSSYETLPTNLLEHPENLDLVNWILNNFSAGTNVLQYSYSPDWHSAEWPFSGTFTSLGTNGPATWEDIQAAIWGLLEDDPVYDAWRYLPNLTNRNTNQANAWGIIYAALNTPGAEGFRPGCYQKATAILVPDGGNIQIVTAQPSIYQLEIPCQGCCNHTWGDGKYGANFPDCASWAIYFKWNRTCPTR